jgi:sarcosine oxidase subunit delta
MSGLHCPYCGPRALAEFRFRKSLPDPGASAPYERVYERREDPALAREHWQHLEGCRAWLLVIRNPSTGAVFSVEELGASR